VLAQQDRITAHVLRGQGIDIDDARNCLLTIVPAGEEQASGQIPFTPRGKKVLELALRESLSAGSDQVMPEHILLGLLREGDGVACQILGALRVDLAGLRTQVVQALPPPGEVVAEAHRRLRRAEPAGGGEMGFRLAPAVDVRRLLMSAGARALDDGRAEIEIRDVEEALRRRRASEDPPGAAAV
jgi:ATP-dependent Clp protease ATP-binding subunit ClpC